MSWWQALLKRALDLALGFVALVVLLPFGLAIALAVALDSAGSPVYGAKRVGRRGREFTMWKFRSMVRGADLVGPGVTGLDDWRVTRVGAVLRRTKLDEIPQLVNVLAGQMSLVGPRPESPQYVEHWSPEEREVLRTRPGITGPAQLSYVNEEELLAAGDVDVAYERDLMHAKLALDLDYVRHYSLGRDIAILWRTFIAIFSAAERKSNRPRRRYTLSERLRSARPGALILDAALAALMAILAVGLRIDRNNLLAAAATYWVFVPLAAFVRPAVFVLSGAYLRVWRYPTITDAALIVSSLAVGTVIMTIAIFVVMQPAAFPGSVGFPRSALVIEFLLSLLVLGGARFASRVRQEGIDATSSTGAAGPPRPVLIVGAGEAGALLVREMRRNRHLRIEPVAFLDDDPARRHLHIYGVEVAGTIDDLPMVAAEREASEVIVATPRIAGTRLRRVLTLAESAGLQVRTLPSFDELLDESVTVNKIRPVRVEDLLRRAPVEISEQGMRELVSDRTVLVTGAGGSIGSEISRQMAVLGARQIVLFEQAETPLFYIDEELRRRFPNTTVTAILGDVTDEEQVRRAFQRTRPQIVFHAAAHKHVPLSEANVAQAVWVNVRGTRLVAEAARETGCKTFIYVSTDKAVDPASVMGATKRVGELLVQGVGAGADGRFIVVRFGNVLGSQGSVVDIFRQQIEYGGPLTVTHPEATRYFMTIPEAVRLVVFAGAVGQPNEIYILNMGEPVRILDLAQDLIRLSAPQGEKDLQIVFTGLRPGERLHEELFRDDEEAVPTEFPFLLIARSTGGARELALVKRVESLEELAAGGDDETLRNEFLGPLARSA
jgi:FlaA1/EpsC-like NDP-sugar epimerase/lipopolysaccharide/colanic/teichoic acid biosynthesis glycosyltransferase